MCGEGDGRVRATTKEDEDVQHTAVMCVSFTLLSKKGGGRTGPRAPPPKGSQPKATHPHSSLPRDVKAVPPTGTATSGPPRPPPHVATHTGPPLSSTARTPP